MAAHLLVNQIQSGAQEMRRFSNAENLGTLQRLQQNLQMQISDFGKEFALHSQAELCKQVFQRQARH